MTGGDYEYVPDNSPQWNNERRGWNKYDVGNIILSKTLFIANIFHCFFSNLILYNPETNAWENQPTKGQGPRPRSAFAGIYILQL